MTNPVTFQTELAPNLDHAIEALNGEQKSTLRQFTSHDHLFMEHMDTIGSQLRAYFSEDEDDTTWQRLKKSFDRNVWNRDKATSNKKLSGALNLSNNEYEYEEELYKKCYQLIQKGGFGQINNIHDPRKLFAFMLGWRDPGLAKKNIIKRAKLKIHYSSSDEEQESLFSDEEITEGSNRFLSAKDNLNKSTRHNIKLALIFLDALRLYHKKPDQTQLSQPFYSFTDENTTVETILKDKTAREQLLKDFEDAKKKNEQAYIAIGSYITWWQWCLQNPGRVIAILFALGCAISVFAAGFGFLTLIAPAHSLMYSHMAIAMLMGAVTFYANQKITWTNVPKLLFGMFGKDSFLLDLFTYVDENGKKRTATWGQSTGLLFGLAVGVGAGAANGAIAFHATVKGFPIAFAIIGIHLGGGIFFPLAAVLSLVTMISITALLMRDIANLFYVAAELSFKEKVIRVLLSPFKGMNAVLEQQRQEYLKIAPNATTAIAKRMVFISTLAKGISAIWITLAIAGMVATMVTGGIFMPFSLPITLTLVALAITGEIPFAMSAGAKFGTRIACWLSNHAPLREYLDKKYPLPTLTKTPSKEELQNETTSHTSVANVGQPHLFSPGSKASPGAREKNQMIDLTLCGINAFNNALLSFTPMTVVGGLGLATVTSAGGFTMSFASTTSLDGIDPHANTKEHAALYRDILLMQGERPLLTGEVSIKIQKLQNLLQKGSIEPLDQERVNAVFKNTETAKEFQQVLFGIGIENRGMKGAPRKMAILNAEQGQAERYAIDLTLDELAVLQGIKKTSLNPSSSNEKGKEKEKEQLLFTLQESQQKEKQGSIQKNSSSDSNSLEEKPLISLATAPKTDVETFAKQGFFYQLGRRVVSNNHTEANDRFLNSLRPIVGPIGSA